MPQKKSAEFTNILFLQVQNWRGPDRANSGEGAPRPKWLSLEPLISRGVGLPTPKDKLCMRFVWGVRAPLRTLQLVSLHILAPGSCPGPPLPLGHLPLLRTAWGGSAGWGWWQSKEGWVVRWECLQAEMPVLVCWLPRMPKIWGMRNFDAHVHPEVPTGTECLWGVLACSWESSECGA